MTQPDTSISAQILQFPLKQKNTPYCLLDSMLAMGRITRSQHWCGVHFFWLHEISRQWNSSPLDWRDARVAEYKAAVAALEKAWVYDNVKFACVDSHEYGLIENLREGLDILAKQWNIGAVA